MDSRTRGRSTSRPAEDAGINSASTLRRSEREKHAASRRYHGEGSESSRSIRRQSAERRSEAENRSSDKHGNDRQSEVPPTTANVSSAPLQIRFLSKHSNQMLHRRRNDESTGVASGTNQRSQGSGGTTAGGPARPEETSAASALQEQQTKSDKVPSRFDPEYVEMRKLFTEIPWTCEETDLLHNAFFLLSDGFSADLIMLHALYPHRTRRDVEARVQELLQAQPVALRLLAAVELDAAERRQQFRSLAEKGRSINNDVQQIRELMWKASRKNINHGLNKWEGIVRLGVANIPEIRRTQFTMSVLKENMEAVLADDKTKYSKTDKNSKEESDEEIIRNDTVDAVDAEDDDVDDKSTIAEDAARRRRKSSMSSRRTAESTSNYAESSAADGDEAKAAKIAAKRPRISFLSGEYPPHNLRPRATSRENAAR